VKADVEAQCRFAKIIARNQPTDEPSLCHSEIEQHREI
jgi:hypothetical protein